MQILQIIQDNFIFASVPGGIQLTVSWGFILFALTIIMVTKKIIGLLKRKNQ